LEEGEVLEVLVWKVLVFQVLVLKDGLAVLEIKQEWKGDHGGGRDQITNGV
jgi:hypothetical protein